MSLMRFRVGDLARCFGIKPCHSGIEVKKHKVATNATQIVHTVTPGYTFFLTDWVHNGASNAAGHDSVLFVRDASDVEVFRISRFTFQAAGIASASNSSFFPIEIGAGFDICVLADAAGVWSFGFVHGFEEAN